MAGLILGGDLYFDRFSTTGQSTGRILIGNATNLSVNEPTEVKERTSRMRDSFGNALDTVFIKQPAQLELTVDEFNRHVLAIALLGDTVDVTQAGGSITNELITARIGAFVKLDNEQVSAVVVTEDTDTSPVTYVLGTDYEVNLRLGMIRVLEGGAITEGQILRVSYTAAAVSKERTRGGMLPSVVGEIFLDGKNLVTGQSVHFTAPRATLAPNGAVSLLNAGGDFGEFQASGRLNLAPGETAAYYLDLLAG
jgi:hypothetical protein